MLLFAIQNEGKGYLCVMYMLSSNGNSNRRAMFAHVVKEASVNILVTLVGRSISPGNQLVQYKLWDCRMEHVVLEARNWSVSIRF